MFKLLMNSQDHYGTEKNDKDIMGSSVLGLCPHLCGLLSGGVRCTKILFYGFSFQRSLGISIFLISKVVRIISALPTLSRCGGDLMRSLKLNVCTLLGVISGPVMTCLGLRCTNDVSVFSSASGRHHQLILALLLAQLGYNLTIVFSTILHTAYTTN